MKLSNLFGNKDDGFNDKQKAIIDRGRKMGVDTSVYAKKCYDENQMYFILMGMTHRVPGVVDISVYAKPEFNKDQMLVLLNGMKDGFDMRPYARPELDDRQMQQILYGLKRGIDPSSYARTELTPEEMEKSMEELIAQKNNNTLSERDRLEKDYIRINKENGTPLKPYICYANPSLKAQLAIVYAPTEYEARRTYNVLYKCDRYSPDDVIHAVLAEDLTTYMCVSAGARHLNKPIEEYDHDTKSMIPITVNYKRYLSDTE